MERLITMKELVSTYVRYSRAHIMRLVREGEFPQPERLGSGRIAWRESKVDAWQKARFNVTASTGS